jgi:hypothetical protein
MGVAQTSSYKSLRVIRVIFSGMVNLPRLMLDYSNKVK